LLSLAVNLVVCRGLRDPNLLNGPETINDAHKGRANNALEDHWLSVSARKGILSGKQGAKKSINSG